MVKFLGLDLLTPLLGPDLSLHGAIEILQDYEIPEPFKPDSVYVEPPEAGILTNEEDEDVYQMQCETIVGGYRSENGSRYWGEWNSAGQRHGTGTIRLPDKSLLRGNFRENMATGLGVLLFPDGAKYEGELLNGWFHGLGVFWRSDGMKFEGEFKGGRVWGLGLVTFPDGSHGFPRHEGYFQDCRLITSKRCPEIVHKAQKAAFLARIRDESNE